MITQIALQLTSAHSYGGRGRVGRNENVTGVKAILRISVAKHREHTILLSRERVNKGTERVNSLHLSPLVISFILRDFTGKSAAYKS